MVSPSTKYRIPDAVRRHIELGTPESELGLIPSGLDSPSHFTSHLHTLLYIEEASRTRKLSALSLPRVQLLAVDANVVTVGSSNVTLAAGEAFVRLQSPALSLLLAAELAEGDLIRMTIGDGGSVHEGVVASVRDGAVVFAVRQEVTALLTPASW